MAKEVIVYSAPMCGDCIRLKDFLDREGIAYETRDIKADPTHAVHLEQQTGKLGVPYLVINGTWLRGYIPGQPFDENWARSLFEAV